MTQHVYPVGDLRDHVVDGYPKMQCWCRPEIVEDEGPETIVIHNSLDGRERYETGEQLLN